MTVREAVRLRLYSFLVLGIALGVMAICYPAFRAFARSGQSHTQPASAGLTLIRVFSSADDLRHLHPILDRTLGIVAGPSDPVARVDALKSPSAVATDSNHHVFVADPGAQAVHIFDFTHRKYGLLDKDGERLQAPVALSTDGQDNLYVVDQGSRMVLVYDAAGKFHRYLGQLKGGESYFDTPTAVAIDKVTERIYVCDRQRHMVFILDNRGRLIRKLGKRGWGDGPGEFRMPGQLLISGGELFVLDTGNARLQIFDTSGKFLRAIKLTHIDRRAGLAVDKRGNIYVSDAGLNQIQVFRANGQPLYTFDEGALTGNDFSGPTAMWIDADATLYVVDSQNSRVQVFHINGDNPAQ